MQTPSLRYGAIVAPAFLVLLAAAVLAVTMPAVAGQAGGRQCQGHAAWLQDARAASAAAYAGVGSVAAVVLALEASKRGIDDDRSLTHWLRALGVVLLSVGAIVGMGAAVEFRPTDAATDCTGDVEADPGSRHERARGIVHAALGLNAAGVVALLASVGFAWYG